MSADLDPHHELPEHPEFLELPRPSQLSLLHMLLFGLIIFGIVVGGGYWWMVQNTAPLTQYQNIGQPLSPSSPSPKSESDWKKYSNEALGYSFEYPPQYSISEKNYPKVDYEFVKYFHRLVVSEGGNLYPKYYFAVTIFSNINQWPLDKWLDEHQGEASNPYSGNWHEPEEYYLDRRKGLSFINEVCGNGNVCFQHHIYVVNNTSTYRIELATEDPITDQERELFDQILSTFRFID